MPTGSNGSKPTSHRMRKEILKVTAPIFLLRASETCWRCNSKQEVIAIAFKWVIADKVPDDEQPSHREPLILQNIQRMPQTILDHILTIHPQFEKRKSKTSGTAYYMNICKCGAHFGDYYLFSEPGGAFFPMDDGTAAQIKIIELPFTGSFQFVCGYSMGLAESILEHGENSL
jgi:hypothetical protein